MFLNNTKFPGYGGAVSVSHVDIQLHDSSFFNNRATWCGAVGMVKSSAWISKTSFLNNILPGVIYYHAQQKVLFIRDTHFLDNLCVFFSVYRYRKLSSMQVTIQKCYGSTLFHLHCELDAISQTVQLFQLFFPLHFL